MNINADDTALAAKQAPPLETSDRGAAERALRVDLAASYRLAAMFGWSDLIFTHLSARVPGPEHHFLINPFGWLFEEITASSLVKVDLDGNVVDGSPHGVNPAGFAIHSAIHRSHPDAHCVFHVHTVDGLAVSCQDEGLLGISPVAMMVRGDLAYYDFTGPGQQGDEGPRTAAALGEKHFAILRNHGTLAVGKSCAQAFLRLYFLERACSIQVRAQSGGGKLRYPPSGVEEDLFNMAQGGGDTSARLAWPALLRKVERIDPSYRD